MTTLGADRDAAAHRRGIRLRRRLRELAALGSGRRDVRAARRRPGRRRLALSPRRPDGRPGRPDGVPDHGLRAADAGRPRPAKVRRHRHRRHPLRRRRRPAPASTTPPTSGSVGCSGSSSRSWAARSRSWPGTRSAACSGRSTSARRHGRGGPDREGRHRRSRRQRADRRLALRERPRGPPVRGEPAVGGHVKTVAVETPAGRSRSTPASSSTTSTPTRAFIRLLAELGVATQPSDMSLGSACRACGVEFSSRGLRGFFAQPSAVARPAHWRMIADILRFYRDARATLDAADAVDRRRSATTSTTAASARASATTSWCRSRPRSGPPAPTGILDFPVDYLLRFLDNHGLIGVGNALQWRTIQGGSLRYVERIVAALPPGTVRSGDPVVDVVAHDAGRRRSRTEAGGSGALRRGRHGDPRRRRAAPPRRCRPASGPRSAASSTRPTRSCSTPTSGCCPVAGAPGPRGTSTRRTAAPGRRAHDDLPHEPAAVAARPDAVLASR